MPSLPLKRRALMALAHPKSVTDADNHRNFSNKEAKTRVLCASKLAHVLQNQDWVAAH
jgi:hypothetical protein